MKSIYTISAFSKFFAPVAAGIETNMLETYADMTTHGWAVTVHTSKDTHTEKNTLDSAETIKGIVVKRQSMSDYFKLSDSSWKNADIVALHNFDVFPHIFIFLYTLILKLTGRKKYKLFLTPHGGYNPEWSAIRLTQHGGFNAKFQFLSRPVAFIKALYQFTLGMIMVNLTVDAIRAISGWEEAEMVKRGIRPSLIKVIGNGVEQEAYVEVDKLASTDIKKQVQSWGKYLLQIGRVYPIKNYETVIKALPSLPTDINFVIVGPIADLPYQQSLIELAKKLGVEKRLIFAGIHRGIDKYYLIKHSVIMVHMAVWESFCNVVHEALSQGKICIVADNTNLHYLVQDDVHGYRVPTQDTVLLAEKINYVLTNIASPKLRAMAATNKKYGQEESWSSVSKKIQNYFIGLVK